MKRVSIVLAALVVCSAGVAWAQKIDSALEKPPRPSPIRRISRRAT